MNNYQAGMRSSTPLHPFFQMLRCPHQKMLKGGGIIMPRQHNITLLALLILACLIPTTQAHGIPSMFKITVFSKMDGVVTKGGRPIEGAIVKRSADHYNDKVYTDQAVTDENGRFTFRAISTWSLRPIIFDTVILQEITIEYEGTSYMGWNAFKGNNHPRGELLAKPGKSPRPIECVFDLDGDEKKRQQIVLDEVRITTIDGLCELK